jgi:hypothetical protein
MSEWRRYDSHLIPAFHERFEERWGKGTAPFLDPEAHEEPVPRAQWVNPTTGAALAVVPVWSAEEGQQRSFGVFYLPPPAASGCSGRGTRATLNHGDTEHLITLRNDAYRKAVAHAKEFLFGSQ